MRKWAIEGLSYLTLDAEVKEKLIEDKEALQSLIEVAKVDSESIMIAGNFLTAKTSSIFSREIFQLFMESSRLW